LKRFPHLFFTLLLTLIVGCALFSAASAEVDWKVISERTLTDEPLDLAMSQDGQIMFILLPGKVLLYSVQQNRATDNIPVDGSFDSITVYPGNNVFALSSSKTKALKVIAFEVSQDIDVSNHPFKGPENAPVTIAVFSDYQ